MSQFKRLVIVVTASACAFALLAASTGGETKPATRPAEKLDPRLLKLIPDHCLGFVTVRSIEGTAGRAEALIRQAMGPVVPPDFKAMDYLKQGLNLGEGFDSNGSFALVMLHPKQYAPDLLKPPPDDDDPGGGSSLRNCRWRSSSPARAWPRSFPTKRLRRTASTSGSARATIPPGRSRRTGS